jgi:hypothetical protein
MPSRKETANDPNEWPVVADSAAGRLRGVFHCSRLFYPEALLWLGIGCCCAPGDPSMLGSPLGSDASLQTSGFCEKELQIMVRYNGCQPAALHLPRQVPSFGVVTGAWGMLRNPVTKRPCSVTCQSCKRFWKRAKEMDSSYLSIVPSRPAICPGAVMAIHCRIDNAPQSQGIRTSMPIRFATAGQHRNASTGLLTACACCACACSGR